MMRYVIDPRCQPQRFTDRHWWLVPVLLLLACLLNVGCEPAPRSPQAERAWRTERTTKAVLDCYRFLAGYDPLKPIQAVSEACESGDRPQGEAE